MVVCLLFLVFSFPPMKEESTRTYTYICMCFSLFFCNTYRNHLWYEFCNLCIVFLCLRTWTVFFFISFRLFASLTFTLFTLSVVVVASWWCCCCCRRLIWIIVIVYSLSNVFVGPNARRLNCVNCSSLMCTR